MADIYNIATQAYQQGRQRAQDKRLNELAQLAMRNPSALPELGAQMAGIDASAGLQLSGAIRDRQLADSERNRSRALGLARFLRQIPQESREQVAAAYRKRAPDLPQTLDDNSLDAYVSMAQAGGMGDARVQSRFVGEDGQVYAMMSNSPIPVPTGVRAENLLTPETLTQNGVEVSGLIDRRAGEFRGFGAGARGQASPQQGGGISIPVPGGQIDVADPAAAEFLRNNPAVMQGLSSGQPFTTTSAAPSSGGFITNDPVDQARRTASATAAGRILTENQLAQRSAETARATTAATETGRIEGQREAQPLPPEALAQVMELEDAISTASGLQNRLRRWEEAIRSGQLQLAPELAVRWRLEIASGRPSPQASNYQEFLDELESIRNDVLRLNKGVQTEGDALRAMNEIIANPNAGAYVMQRLGTLIRQNQRAEELQRKQIERIRQNYQTPAQRQAQPQRYENDAGQVIEWNGSKWVEVN